MKAQPLFDRALLRRRRGRGHSVPRDAFLHERVAEDVIERVLDINREFQSSLLLAESELGQSLLAGTPHKLGHIVSGAYTNKVKQLDLLCDEEALPFGDQSFDFVFSGLSLHHINNIPKFLMDVKRLLRPDGLFICAFFGGETLKELRHALYEAEDKVSGRVSPRVSPMIDVQQAASLLQKAGFTMPVVDRDLVKVKYSELTGLYADLRRMGENNILNGRSRRATSRKLFDTLVEIYRRDYADENSKLTASFDIIWMTGWSPHPDQQKPLKPGSAKSRLSEALGVKEHKL